MQPLTLRAAGSSEPAKNPFLRAIEVQLLDRAGAATAPVGRISAQVNRRHLERYDDATGHFGFLDAVDDPEVFAR